MALVKRTVCPQWASNWDVKSMTGIDDKTAYLVQFHRLEPASCKHIERVRRHGCFYTPATTLHQGPNDWERLEGIRLMSTAGIAEGNPERCPGCDAYMITVIL
jgi:hypothetical protein